MVRKNSRKKALINKALFHYKNQHCNILDFDDKELELEEVQNIKQDSKNFEVHINEDNSIDIEYKQQQQ